jgi:hypothetical protein
MHGHDNKILYLFNLIQRGWSGHQRKGLQNLRVSHLWVQHIENRLPIVFNVKHVVW